MAKFLRFPSSAIRRYLNIPAPPMPTLNGNWSVSCRAFFPLTWDGGSYLWCFGDYGSSPDVVLLGIGGAGLGVGAQDDLKIFIMAENADFPGTDYVLADCLTLGEWHTVEMVKNGTQYTLNVTPDGGGLSTQTWDHAKGLIGVCDVMTIGAQWFALFGGNQPGAWLAFDTLVGDFGGTFFQEGNTFEDVAQTNDATPGEVVRSMNNNGPFGGVWEFLPYLDRDGPFLGVGSDPNTNPITVSRNASGGIRKIKKKDLAELSQIQNKLKSELKI